MPLVRRSKSWKSRLPPHLVDFILEECLVEVDPSVLFMSAFFQNPRMNPPSYAPMESIVCICRSWIRLAFSRSTSLTGVYFLLALLPLRTFGLGSCLIFTSSSQSNVCLLRFALFSLPTVSSSDCYTMYTDHFMPSRIFFTPFSFGFPPKRRLRSCGIQNRRPCLYQRIDWAESASLGESPFYHRRGPSRLLPKVKVSPLPLPRITTIFPSAFLPRSFHIFFVELFSRYVSLPFYFHCFGRDSPSSLFGSLPQSLFFASFPCVSICELVQQCMA
jgi:hypothetical protein